MFFQPEPPPPQQPAPAPSINISLDPLAWAQAFIDGLTGWANGVPDQLATNATTHVRDIASWFNTSGLNFIARTPLDLVQIGSSIVGGGAVRTFMEPVVNVCIVLAAISVAGHQLFGWPGLEQTAQRIVIAVIMAGVTWRVLDLSVNVLNGFLGTLQAELRMPQIDAPAQDVWLILGTLLLGFVLLVRLALQMGKRLVWLLVLYPIGPFASATIVHAKSAWLFGMFWKLWFGWLLGQVMVVVALNLGLTVAARVQGPAGYVLALSTLLMAYDAVHVLAPKDGGFQVSVGFGPARVAF